MNFAEAEVSLDGPHSPRPRAVSMRAAQGLSVLKDNRRRILPHLCGRRAEEDEFYQRLTQQRGKSLICLLYGDERAAQQSFVERLTEIGIREETHALRGAGQGFLLAFNALSWPARDPLEERRQELLLNLWSACNLIPDKELTPSVLYRELHAGKVQCLVLRYVIPLREWDTTSGALLKWYLNFWRDLPNAADGPQIIVFLDFQRATRRNINPLTAWWRKRREKRARQQLEQLVARPPEGFSLLRLREFPLVSRSEVSDWFQRYTIYPAGEIAAQVAQIFPPLVTRLDMQSIADKLVEIPQEYLAEGAIDDVRKRFRALRGGWQHAGRT